MYERFLLEAFLRSVGIQATSVRDHERPDFIVRLLGKDIGIELTNFFANYDQRETTRQIESLEDRVVAKAQWLHQASSASPTSLRVLFQSSANLSARPRDEISCQLAALAADLRLSPFESQRVGQPDPRLPADVLSVYATGVPEHSFAHWHPARSGWVSPLTPGPLQACINEKASLLPAYRQEAEEIWLVIVADSMRPSGFIEARPDFDAASVESPFDATYFYRHPDPRAVRLGIPQ